MALLNIDTVIRETIHTLKETANGGGIEIMSYKRNRTIAVIIVNKKQCTIREKGYLDDEELICIDMLHKNLKKRIKREFPRSRKLRLVKFAHISELERLHQKI